MTPNPNQILDPNHGIDERITVTQRPFALAQGWDWIVTFEDVDRRFPDEVLAYEYARAASRIFRNNDAVSAEA